jgi:hypothetical protein
VVQLVRHVGHGAGWLAAGRDRRLIFVDARRPKRAALAEALAKSMQPYDLTAEFGGLVED